MSQMFETDVSKWLPDDVSAPAEDKVEELGRVVGFLAVTRNKVFERVERAEKTIEQLEDLLAQCCDKLNIPVPFPGQDSDFGLAPKPKKGGN